MEVLRNHSVDAGEFQSCGFLGINESTESTKSRNRENPKYQLHKTPSYVKGALFKLNWARCLCHSFNPPYVFLSFSWTKMHRKLALATPLKMALVMECPGKKHINPVD